VTYLCRILGELANEDAVKDKKEILAREIGETLLWSIKYIKMYIYI